jgi:fatty acid desaturase
MLTNQELRQFSQISELRSTLQIAWDWALMLGIYSLNLLYPHPLLILISMPFMARQQMALLVLLHDGSHSRLYHKPKMNDFMTQFFLGGPVFFSLKLYRKTHLKHHRHPLEPDDPDITLTGGYPISAKSFRRKLVRDMMGISYFKFMSRFFQVGKKKEKKKIDEVAAIDKRHDNFFLSNTFLVASGLVINGGLFAYAALMGHPLLYLLLWWIPLFTYLQVYLRIRGITEHAGYKAGPNQMELSRTVINPAETFFFSPNSVNYHIEHHQYPSVPFFNLHKVHRLLKERGSLPEKNVYRTYRDVVKELITHSP